MNDQGAVLGLLVVCAVWGLLLGAIALFGGRLKPGPDDPPAPPFGS